MPLWEGYQKSLNTSLLLNALNGKKENNENNKEITEDPFSSLHVSNDSNRVLTSQQSLPLTSTSYFLEEKKTQLVKEPKVVNKLSSSKMQQLLQYILYLIKKLWPVEQSSEDYKKTPNKGLSIEMQLIKRGVQKNTLRKQLQNDGYSSNQSIWVIQQLDIKFTETGKNDTSFEIKLDMLFLKNGMETLFNENTTIQFLIEREKRQAEEAKRVTEEIKLQIKDKDLQMMKMRAAKIQEYKKEDKNLSEEDAIKKANAFFGLS